jgi:hypothetical protein
MFSRVHAGNVQRCCPRRAAVPPNIQEHDSTPHPRCDAPLDYHTVHCSEVRPRSSGFVDFGNDSTKPVEIQVRKNGSWLQIQPKITTFSAPVGQKI